MHNNKIENLNLAYLVPSWPPKYAINGIATYVNNLFGGLRKYNVEPAILTPNLYGNDMKRAYELTNENTYSIMKKISNRLISKTNHCKYIQNTLADKIAYTIKNEKLNIELFEIEESYGVHGLLRKKINSKVVVRLHGPWFLVGKPIDNKQLHSYHQRTKLEGRCLTNEMAMTSPSNDVLEKTREFYNLDLTRARVIPNPIAPSLESDLWKNKNKNRPMILFVGRFDDVKGGDIVLRAFGMLAAREKDFRLIFIGPDVGVHHNGSLIKFNEYLKIAIPDTNIHSRIEYLGQLNPDEITKYRQLASVVLLLSRYENFSMTLLEAMSQGCPVVATSVGGLKEIINDKENGLLVESESPEMVVESVINLIHDQDRCEFISRNAIESCNNKYNPEIVAKQTLDYYKTIL